MMPWLWLTTGDPAAVAFMRGGARDVGGGDAPRAAAVRCDGQPAQRAHQRAGGPGVRHERRAGPGDRPLLHPGDRRGSARRRGNDRPWPASAGARSGATSASTARAPRSSSRRSPSARSPWVPSRGRRRSSGGTSRRGSRRPAPLPPRCSPASGFDRELVDVIRGLPGGGRGRGTAERRGPAARDDGTSREMLLTALPDFATSGSTSSAARRDASRRATRRGRLRAVGAPAHRTSPRGRRGPDPRPRRQGVRPRRLGPGPRARRVARLLLRPAQRLRDLRDARGPRLGRRVRRAADPPRRPGGDDARMRPPSRTTSGCGSSGRACRSRSRWSRSPAGIRPTSCSAPCSSSSAGSGC